MWGRTLFQNVRKFIQFQMTMNISLITVIFLASLSVGRPPFAVIHLLWMNLIMDTFAAVALCTEPPYEEKYEDENAKKDDDDEGKSEDQTDKESRMRISRKDPIFNKNMWRNILPQAIYQIVVMCILMFCGQLIFFEESFNIITEPDTPVGNEITGRMKLNTMCFHTFMLMNMINLINCRDVSDDHLRIFKTFFNNKLFLLTLVVEIGVQVSMIYFGSKPDNSLHLILGTNPLTWAMHITAWVLALLTIPLHVLVVKFVPNE